MNFKKLLDLLQRKQPVINTNKNLKNDSDLVLVLGNSGAGKSTIINYFLENIKLEVNSDTMEPFYEQIDPNIGPQIGHRIDVSETKTVNAYQCNLNSNSFHFCDFPGFFNTDQVEENIVLGLSIQHLMRSFDHFISILVVVSEDDLRSPRATCFKELLAILNGLFSDFDTIKNSLMFVFNKSKNGKSLEMCKRIKNVGSDELKLLNVIQDEATFCKSVTSFDTLDTRGQVGT
jgi:GTP-binding protein EngB required for normal cell division